MQKTSILIIYTGGTIGMATNHVTGALEPLDFSKLLEHVPEMNQFVERYDIDYISFEKIIDSANISIDHWVMLAEIIEEKYSKYDGFVVLHGTDTMSYSASALSFMLENLQKPVIFTGSQVPIGMLRTDGKENFISAIEIAAAYKEGKPIVPEVCIYFENQLFRGNRATKHRSDSFNAFASHNYPNLAEAGIKIRYNTPYIRTISGDAKLVVHKKMSDAVVLLKIFPGMEKTMKHLLEVEDVKAWVIETYGVGNAPTASWFLDTLKEAQKRGILLLNVSQCPNGGVDMGEYETSVELKRSGVLNGRDMTTETAITKMMFLLGEYGDDSDAIKRNLVANLRGEIMDN